MSDSLIFTVLKSFPQYIFIFLDKSNHMLPFDIVFIAKKDNPAIQVVPLKNAS